MSKKLIVGVAGTLVSSLFAMVVVVGCSSSDPAPGGADPDGGGGTPTPEAGTPDRRVVDDPGPPPTPEEGTVGNPCSTDSECAVANSVNDNICSKGVNQGDDLFGTPVCIQASCTIGSGNTIDDITCDDRKGLCVPTGQGASGVCFPFCAYSSTKIESPCAGGNKCAGAYIANGQSGTTAIGFCAPSCTGDTDCKGTAGQKCQIETGRCVTSANHVDFKKKVGEGCDSTATTQACACEAGSDAKKGLCGSTCVTGTAGNAACATASGGDNWKCTAKLKTTYTNNGQTLTGYTAQPDDVVGTCALACPNGDSDCADLATAAGTTVSCLDFVDGKYCSFPAK